jgi:hypothetical protein
MHVRQPRLNSFCAYAALNNENPVEQAYKLDAEFNQHYLSEWRLLQIFELSEVGCLMTYF